jgi:hypothetical protein
LNERGEIVSNANAETVIFKKLVGGELPAPFCIEKFNFSPWEIMGKFNFKDSKDPLSFITVSSDDKQYD